jgi:DNA polymerase
MKTLFVDAETYWSDTHSLTKMHPVEYVMHPETEIQSMAVKPLNEPAFVLFGDEVVQWAKETDFSDTLLVGHNLSHFDSMLLAWRLGIKPKMWGCTLAMAREAGLAKTVGGSLNKVSMALNVGAKLDLVATGTKGKKLKDFSRSQIESMRVYNQQDVDLCHGIFEKLLPQLSWRSLKLIDMTIRMLTEPKFVVDNLLLNQTLIGLQARKANALLDVGTTMFPDVADILRPEQLRERAREVLSSGAKFAAYLKAKDVDVPLKESPTTLKMIPALAKSDEGMQALLEHEDPDVAAAAAARLSVKSTILETRIQTFQKVSEACEGRLPIALNYYGADNTGRWSGGMRMNQQNLPRVDPDSPKPSDALRNCLQAPPGHKVVVADLTAIELRVNHTLWKVPSSMAAFKEDPGKADLYVKFAAMLHKKLEAEITKHERQEGKVAQLGLGFGAGAPKFQVVARALTGGKLKLTEEESGVIVATWRAFYPEIVNGWRRGASALEHISAERYGIPIDPWGICHTAKDGVVTPQGFIHYPDLRMEPSDNSYGHQWVYGHGAKKTKIYGAKVVENIVQHLAREVMADNLMTIADRYPVAHIVHDEVILVVPEDQAQEALDYVLSVMRTPPAWWPELVTWAAGSIGDTYGSAK